MRSYKLIGIVALSPLLVSATWQQQLCKKTAQVGLVGTYAVITEVWCNKVKKKWTLLCKGAMAGLGFLAEDYISSKDICPKSNEKSILLGNFWVVKENDARGQWRRIENNIFEAHMTYQNLDKLYTGKLKVIQEVNTVIVYRIKSTDKKNCIYQGTISSQNSVIGTYECKNEDTNVWSTPKPWRAMMYDSMFDYVRELEDG